ncbi:hypothetical protein M9H77_11802 [Catharanthus roseus]|uniref:Uncharacterized protein n=1 Tax=Catharanthus roseus TaxID=4058 RepID=A0ACC0BFS0_CATRO|nr:hypothetical protein M9H77_11802 [Catharanthus roseus]
MAPPRNKVIEVAPTETMDISALEARSKKREDPVLNKEKQPMFEDEAALIDKLEGAKVQKRKRTANEEKKKVVSQMQVQMNVPGLLSLVPIAEENAPNDGDMGIIPKIEVVDNCELLFPSWSVRMKRHKASSGTEKEVKEMKTMLSGVEIVTDWSWSHLMDSLALASFQAKKDKHIEMKLDGTQNTKIGEEMTSRCRKRKSISPNGKGKYVKLA